MYGTGKNNELESFLPSFRSWVLAKGLLMSPRLDYTDAGVWWASVMTLKCKPSLWLRVVQSNCASKEGLFRRCGRNVGSLLAG